ncbi:hypothetical protein EJB05_19244 [Eragrostis curvula]|uniref:Uncharacterized protein n=1 Tax=Eragrostis curvula TaxID=38414 RepID=A0A5J9UWS0_9POAL|nr:hypothetical protein EJB05_19244 [Eragrostis curvula]
MTSAMAIPKEARTATSFLAFVVVALLVSSCSASRDGPAKPKGFVIKDDSKCEVMAPCNRENCCAYCLSIGLRSNAFCTFKPDLQFYCCCIILPEASPTTSPAVTGSKIHTDVLKCLV